MNTKFLRYKLRSTLEAFLAPKITRDPAWIEENYRKTWTKFGDAGALWSGYSRPVSLYGRPAFQTVLEDKKITTAEFSAVLSSMQPETVLEAGCGNGVNIFPLAVMNGDVKRWEGLELTDAGVAAANKFLADPPEDISWIARLPYDEIKRRIGRADITFTKGDMTALPYPDNSFDCIFTCMAIEQAPRASQAIFKEIYRVTRKYAFFYEGFREVNSAVQRLNRRRKDYFTGSIDEATAAGFTIVAFRELPIDKITQQDGLLICRKDPRTL